LVQGGGILLRVEGMRFLHLKIGRRMDVNGVGSPEQVLLQRMHWALMRGHRWIGHIVHIDELNGRCAPAQRSPHAHAHAHAQAAHTDTIAQAAAAAEP